MKKIEFRKKSNRRLIKPFTLIELLVVVAIIGILSSLLLPSLGKARDKGKAAVCKNNQKQLAIAFSMYMDDNDGMAPLCGTRYQWNDYLAVYDGRDHVPYSAKYSASPISSDLYGEAKIYGCPSSNVGTPTGASILSYTYFRYDGGSMNTGAATWSKSNLGTYSVQLSTVTDASSSILLHEFWDSGNKVGRNWGSAIDFRAIFDNPNKRGHFQDTGKSTYLMADGSVHSLTFENTLMGIGARNDTRETMWDLHK